MDGYLLHPLGVCVGNAHTVMLCRGYNFWSGIGSDIGEITIAGAVLTSAFGAYRHFNCEEPGCWRPGHHHPEHGRPVCRLHYHTHEPPKAPE